MSHPQM